MEDSLAADVLLVDGNNVLLGDTDAIDYETQNMDKK